jgi:cytoskeleton protein RodZ
MAERKKKQQHHEASSDVVRPESASVGETLRTTRLAKKLELDDVSHAIHIRPSQLKAIEENNIESLPGMTYAVGFVRSYANFLGLNGAEIVHRFKAEQGHSPAQTRLSFPEPIVDTPWPDPMMVGVGAFLAVVILVVWTIYSNMHGSSKAATQIPPAPAVTSVADASPSATTPAPDAASVTAPTATVTTTDQAATAAAAPAATATPATAAAPVTAPAATDANAGQPASPAVAAAVPAATPAMPPVTTSKAAPEKAADKTTAATPATETEAADDSADSEDAASADDGEASAKKTADKKDSTIKIKAGKSRITLKASLPTWVQVTDGQQNVLYRKVLRPGEQYAVPDQPGLVLDTANAGGLTIVVDGAPVQPAGKTGEIVRGVALDPKALKVKRVLVRD